MSLSADQLVDRARLKKELKRWRLLALLFLVGGLIFAMRNEASPVLPSAKGYIARIKIEGFIGDDDKREEMLTELTDNKSVKAVLVRFDSPGGTALGGEELYRSLLDLSQKKPVVAIMRTACTSACYMASLGTSHLMARDTSITGSVGVLLEMAEVTELAKKLGIEPITVKSGVLKAAPSPFEKFTDEQRSYIQDVVNASFQQFLNLVTSRRTLSTETIALVKDGRIFTGTQAMQYKLIDQIGGEKEAIAWLETEKKLPKNLNIRDVEPPKEKNSILGRFEQSAKRLIFGANTQRLDGLVSIWQPIVR